MTGKAENRIELKKGERIDDLQRKGYGIIQNPAYFCFGIDAVLLSDFARVKKGETVLDLCTGTGVIPLLLSARTEGSRFYGVEIQDEVVDMARRSVLLNDLSGRVIIEKGDVREISESGKIMLSGRVLDQNSGIDVITVNPPYMKDEHGLKNPDEALAAARHEVLCSLSDVTAASSRLLNTGGRMYMVHRPNRLPEILCTLKEYKLEPKRIRLVYPYRDKEANLLLIEAVKGGRAECRVERPLVVYESPGVYTEEVRSLYQAE